MAASWAMLESKSRLWIEKSYGTAVQGRDMRCEHSTGMGKNEGGLKQIGAGTLSVKGKNLHVGESKTPPKGKQDCTFLRLAESEILSSNGALQIGQGIWLRDILPCSLRKHLVQI